MKTLILSSSLSKKSRSFILCNHVADELIKQGVEVTLVDAQNMQLAFYHQPKTTDMEKLAEQVKDADNIIIGMGVHLYSMNDSLKAILDTCFDGATGKFFGVLCAGGGDKSYLATQHLTQICMNEWRMIQLPRVIYATKKDFDGVQIASQNIQERMQLFLQEFIFIGNKLLA